MGAQIDWSSLVRLAWVAKEKAYAPYSKFAVGAALLGESGEIFLGCNIENVSFGLTICAERSAVANAVQAGSRQFLGIAIVADWATPVTPCGACRQVLAEFDPALPVYAVGRGGVSHSWLLSELLPSPFGRIAGRSS